MSVQDSVPDSNAGQTANDENIVAPATNPPIGKRQFTLVMILLAAMTGGAALMARRTPQSAVAAPIRSAVVPASGESSASRSDPATGVSDQIIAKFRFAPADVQVPLEQLKGNPFAASPGQPVQLPDDAAESQRREQERQDALEAVQGLQLQSITREESHRACTINSTLYQEGQEVDGFVVEEIATTSVVVRRGIYRFELRVR